MDDAEQICTVTVESLGHADLPGSMLRASFRRGGGVRFYLSPFQSITLALLTAGLWPTGLLLFRLWIYASFQRFRVCELANWLAARQDVRGQPWSRLLRAVRPTFAFIFGGAWWLTAVGSAAVVIWNAVTWFAGGAGSMPAPSRSPAFFLMVVGSQLASLALIFSILVVRLAAWRVVDRLRVFDFPINAQRNRFDLPRWVLWPLVGGVLIFALIAMHWRSCALWGVAAITSVLAAEVQRGYIIVADRRLRICVARAIGRIMYGPGARR